PHPPSSTLFPYTTLFRSELLEIGGLPLVSPYDKPTRIEALRYYRRVVEKFDLHIEFDEQVFALEREQGPDRQEIFAVETRSSKRSEEHTSELQSPCNLVC